MPGVTSAYRGAISVTGANATFTLNSGTVTNNHRAPGASNQYGAGNIAVTHGATFTMNGGEVSDGRGSAVRTDAYGEVGGIGAYQGGHVVINDGLITRNSGWTGGILAYYWNIGASRAAIEAQALTHRNTVEINGGTISENTAGFSGGGVFVFGNGELTMTGGLIANNSAPNGGGVGTMDLYVAGADRTWREIPFDGANLDYTSEEWAELSPAAFTMTGGTIQGNTATRTGAGINVISNRVLLTGGQIRDNVVNNVQSGQGGGVFDNYLDTDMQSHGIDIGHDNFGGVGAMAMTLSNRMLGGGDVTYYFDNPGARFDPANPGEPVIMDGDQLYEQGLYAAASAADMQRAQDAAQLLITGNYAYRGGGIGTNGSVVIGYGDGINLTVPKSWQDAAGNTILNTALPTSVQFELQRKAMSADEIAAITGPDGELDLTGIAGETVRTFPVCAATPSDIYGPAYDDPAGDWTETCPPLADGEAGVQWTRTLLDYPEADPNGLTYVYFLTEVEQPGYTASLTATRAAGTSFTFGMTNTQKVVDVLMTKQWEGEESAAPAEVTVDLLRAAVDPDTYATIVDPATGAIDVEGAAALDLTTVESLTLTRADGWTRTVADLRQYDDAGLTYVYMVREAATAGYTSAVTGAFDGERAAFAFTVVNTPVPVQTPTPTTPPATTPPATTPPPTTPPAATPPAATKPPALVVTGADVEGLVGAAAILFAAGAGLLVVRRRRA